MVWQADTTRRHCKDLCWCRRYKVRRCHVVVTFSVFLEWLMLEQSASLCLNGSWTVTATFFDLNRLSMNDFILLLNMTWIFNVILSQFPFLSTPPQLTVAASSIAVFMNRPTLHLMINMTVLTSHIFNTSSLGFCWNFIRFKCKTSNVTYGKLRVIN